MPNQVFSNAAVITGAGVIPDGMVVTAGDTIRYVGPRRDEEIPPGAEAVDAGGHYLAPGFIDMHVHGGGGSDFMDATAQDLQCVLRYHGEHGTTSLCATTATASLPEILNALDVIERHRFSPGVRILGAHIEGPYLNPTKRGCHLPGHVRPPAETEWRQILERTRIASMTLAPELPGARPLIQELRRGGSVASAGHSEALYPEMEEAADWGVNHVTHLYCAMTDAMSNRLRGTPQARRGGVLEAVYLDDRLTSELISDGVHLPPESLALAFRIKGYEKLAIVTDAMRGAGMPDGVYTFGGRNGVEAVVRDGTARLPVTGGLASSVMPMNEMVRTFQNLVGCPLWQAIHMASLTPATILGWAGRIGSLSPGKAADILIIDEQVGVRGAWVAGTRIV